MAFCTDDPNMRNEWLTVGSARNLHGSSAQRPQTARLLGENLALWTGPDGLPVCHGPQGPLAVRQHCGYLWVCCGSAPTRPLFVLPESTDPARRLVDCGGIGVATSGLRVVENFLDMGHFPFVHAGTLGQLPHTEVLPYRVEIDPHTDEILAIGCQFYQPRTSASADTGLMAQYRYRVMQPLCAALYKSSPGRPGAQDVIVLMVQPLDEENAIAHCLLVYFEDQLSDAALISFQQAIFGQDKPILENQRPRRLPLDGPLETHMRCDLASVTYRRWLKGRGMVFGVAAPTAAAP